MQRCARRCVPTYAAKLRRIRCVQGLADSPFLDQNWHYVVELYPISREDLLELLARRAYLLMIAGGIAACVLVLVLVSACILQRTLHADRLSSAAVIGTDSERTNLMAEDDDDGYI